MFRRHHDVQHGMEGDNDASSTNDINKSNNSNSTRSTKSAIKKKSRSPPEPRATRKRLFRVLKKNKSASASSSLKTHVLWLVMLLLVTISTTMKAHELQFQFQFPRQQQQQQDQQLEIDNDVKNEPFSGYSYVHKEAFGDPQPWTDWSKCDTAAAFETNCHPRPANCTIVSNDIYSKKGIGNALLNYYLPPARGSLNLHPDCAPILKDKFIEEEQFRLLDYVHEPKVVVPVLPALLPYEKQNKCILHSITQPREAVSAKVQQVASKFGTKHGSLPLVAMNIRTGWSDESSVRAVAWDALGDCTNDYPQHHINHTSTPLSINDLDLKGMVLDTAHAADTIFGVRNWRLYLSSDAPGARRYAQYILQLDDRTPKIVWNDGSVGHNFHSEGEETSISAFTDMVVMSQADFLVSLSSKYPKAAAIRSMCPQITIQFNVVPRHGLANKGHLLDKVWKQHRHRHNKDNKRSANASNPYTPWTPELTEGEMQEFWNLLPHGQDNPCAKSDNPIRSCYCMIKQGHQ